MAENKETKQTKAPELDVVQIAGMDTDSQPDTKIQYKDPEKFLEEFDWHNFEEGIDKIEDEKLDEFEELVEENFVDTLDNEVVEGKVINITDQIGRAHV